MSLDFPSSPAIGQQHPFTPVPGQPVYIWDGEKWVPAPLTGAVRYDAVQSLSGSQQAQARDNIGASSGTTGAVRYDTAQTLTTPQLVQARTNIYAAPFDAMAYSGMQINGGMEVSQEFGLPGGRSTPGWVCDGWILQYSGMALSANIPAMRAAPGITYGLNCFVNTAQPSLGAGDYAYIGQRIEGWRCARLAWGFAGAQPITISFWSFHFRPGTYSVTVLNHDNSRSYSTTYNHAVSNIAQYNSITIPGDVGGSWDVGNSVGMLVVFAVAAGATYIAPAPNTWNSSLYIAAPGQVNGVAATSDTFRLTGVTVLPGTQAPTAAQSPNIMRPYDQELVTCQRYYYRTSACAGGYGPVGNPNFGGLIQFPVTMRATPTLVIASGSLANASAFTADNATPGSFRVYATPSGAVEWCWFMDNFIYAADARL